MARNSDLHRAFCFNVRGRRQELELTQLEVADRLSMSQPAYAAIEAGRRIPGPDTVEHVADALETKTVELLGRLLAARGRLDIANRL